MKILFFDIENVMRPEHIFHPGKRGSFGGRAAGFCADLAYVLVFGYKWLGDKKSQSIYMTKKQMKDNPFDDQVVLEQAYQIMQQADVIVSWYGKGHDFPFLNSRMAQLGLYMDPKIVHLDLYNTAKSKLRLSSNRLDKAAEFFNLPMKFKVAKTLWPDCWAGKHESLVEMADYCRQDCDVLEGVYHKLIPLGVSLPNLTRSDRECPSCGAIALIGNGYRLTQTARYHRLRCSSCGSHTKGEKVDD